MQFCRKTLAHIRLWRTPGEMMDLIGVIDWRWPYNTVVCCCRLNVQQLRTKPHEFCQIKVNPITEFKDSLLIQLPYSCRLLMVNTLKHRLGASLALVSDVMQFYWKTLAQIRPNILHAWILNDAICFVDWLTRPYNTLLLPYHCTY